MAENTNVQIKERAFQSAQTHSKRVRWIKRLLPFFAFGLVCIVGATVFLSRTGLGIAFDLPNTTLVDGKLVMANPNMDGFTKDERPFRVTAVRAIQDLAVQDSLELESLSADVELEGGQSARLTSPTGMFDSNSNTLVLPSEALITTSDGLQATMGQANVNIQNGSVTATNSVRIVNPESLITAEAMQIEDGGKRIVFEENVRLVLKPQSNNKNMREAQTSQAVKNAQDSGIN